MSATGIQIIECVVAFWLGIGIGWFWTACCDPFWDRWLARKREQIRSAIRD